MTSFIITSGESGGFGRRPVPPGSARIVTPMKRHAIDCRELTSEEDCTVRISADNRRELLDEAVRHVVDVHHHEDTPQFRYDLQWMFKILEEDAVRPPKGEEDVH